MISVFTIFLLVQPSLQTEGGWAMITMMMVMMMMMLMPNDDENDKSDDTKLIKIACILHCNDIIQIQDSFNISNFRL